MSYHNRLDVLECDAYMTAKSVRKSRRALDKANVLPESNFLDELLETADDAADDDEPIRLNKKLMWWSGNHAGPDELAQIAPLIVGKLSGYFVGEDGSLNGAFQIEGGKLYKCRVEVVLTRESAQ